jgi:3-deoxy-D-manno-octulosonic-acid transferase
VYLLYSLALAIAFVLAAPWYLWKGRGTGKYTSSFLERTGRLPASLNADRGPSVWIHAVSVGEVLAARALVAPLKARFPNHKVYVSTTTVTGQGVARRTLSVVDGTFYAPFDLVGPVSRALDLVRPSLLVLVETELWPNLIHQARRRGVRIAVVNGRISDGSFAGYRRARWLLKRVLADVDLFLMQAPAHAERILALGAPPDRVRVAGNLKFDAVGSSRTSDELEGLFRRSADRPIWVAGSTMPGEEEIVLRAFREVRKAIPSAGLIMAPRHPERCSAVGPLIEAAGFQVARRTLLAPGGWQNGSVVLLDTLGELAQIYPLASVVFVGGSLVPTGGHNVLEPAAAGRAVVVGPHMDNFREIAQAFQSEDALVQIASQDELAGAIVRLLADGDRRAALGARALALVDENRGAVERTAAALAGLVA